MKGLKQVANSRLYYHSLTILIVMVFLFFISCTEKREARPTFELFNPNPNMTIEGLKKLELHDAEIHNCNCLVHHIDYSGLY